MGDRRIAVLSFPAEYGADIGLYTHWDGYELVAMAEAACEVAAPRKGDTTYAARIIIDQLTKGSRDSETGWGIFPLAPGADPELFAESSYPVVDIDVDTLTVTVRE